jgi:hypothetical protein
MYAGRLGLGRNIHLEKVDALLVIKEAEDRADDDGALHTRRSAARTSWGQREVQCENKIGHTDVSIGSKRRSGANVRRWGTMIGDGAR